MLLTKGCACGKYVVNESGRERRHTRIVNSPAGTGLTQGQDAVEITKLGEGARYVGSEVADRDAGELA